MDARFQGSILDRAEFVMCRLDYTEFMGAEMSYTRFLEPRVRNNKLQRWYFRGAFTEPGSSVGGLPISFELRLRKGLLPMGWESEPPPKDEERLENIILKGIRNGKHVRRIVKAVKKERKICGWSKKRVKKTARAYCDLLKEHVENTMHGIKPDASWESLEQNERHYTEEDVDRWIKAYEENRKIPLELEGSGRGVDGHPVGHPLESPVK